MIFSKEEHGIEFSLDKEVARLKNSLSDREHEKEFVKKWESLFYVLLTNIPDTIYFKDPQSRFILINQAQADLLGLSHPSQAVGKTDFDFFTSEHARAAFEDEQRIIKEGTPVVNKRELIRNANGDFRWVLATKVPILDDDGMVGGIAGISRDITEQVNAENVIKQSEQKFRSVWKNSYDGMRLIDDTGTIVSVNNAFCAMVGKSAEELIGNNFNIIYKPDEQKVMKQKFIARFDDRKIESNFEREVELWNGKRVWYEISNSFVESGDREVLLLSIFRDITERKDLIKNLKMFEDTIKSVNDSITITDLSNNIIYVNKAFCNIYGYREMEVIGKPVSILWSNVNPPGQVARILPATLDGGWKGEIQNKRKDGSEFLVYLSTSVIKNDDGQPIALVGVANDITIRKKVEEQAHQAQKLDGIKVLVGGISHHFNNILNIIVGYTSLLESDQIDKKKLKHFLGIISDAAERGTDLVQHLTTFIKKSPMRSKQINLVDTIGQCIEAAKESFPDTIKFDIQCEQGHTIINADPDHMRQCVLNILLNSRDAMKEGGTLSVRTSLIDGKVLKSIFQEASHSEYLCIEITDTGIGMDKKTKTRIFEPFFTTKDFGEGTGLGLPTVSGIVESHNGFINVKSEPGRGTSVFLYFPTIN